VVLVVRATAVQLAGIIERLSGEHFTYSEVGQSASPDLPAGYHHQRATAVVGRGGDAWAKAKAGLLTWQAHRRAGLQVYPPDAPIDAGTVVLSTVRFGPVFVVIPCRVVYKTDEPARFGFAYGTLPGHPEQGEEAFHVAQVVDGTVNFEVVAFSRPAELVTRLAGPVARSVQSRATRRYLDGITGYVKMAKKAGGQTL
jgi:uncharacterized protein (UPF0548 family)